MLRVKPQSLLSAWPRVLGRGCAHGSGWGWSHGSSCVLDREGRWGGQGRDWKGECHHLGFWCWELGRSYILLASPHMDPLATKGRTGSTWKWTPQQSLLHPPTPQLGLQGTWGPQRLGAGRSLVPGGPMAGTTIECQGTAELLCTALRPWKIQQGPAPPRVLEYCLWLFSSKLKNPKHSWVLMIALIFPTHPEPLLA